MNNAEILRRYPRPWKIRPYVDRPNLCEVYAAEGNITIIQWIREDAATLIISLVNDHLQ
jgi:hypothetical protein